MPFLGIWRICQISNFFFFFLRKKHSISFWIQTYISNNQRFFVSFKDTNGCESKIRLILLRRGEKTTNMYLCLLKWHDCFLQSKVSSNVWSVFKIFQNSNFFLVGCSTPQNFTSPRITHWKLILTMVWIYHEKQGSLPIANTDSWNTHNFHRTWIFIESIFYRDLKFSHIFFYFWIMGRCQSLWGSLFE